VSLLKKWRSMMIDQNINPKIHLSFSERGWLVISQGSPLCDYKPTYAEVMKVVLFYRVTVPEVTWNGDRSEWVHTQSIAEVSESKS